MPSGLLIYQQNIVVVSSNADENHSLLFNLVDLTFVKQNKEMGSSSAN